MFTGRKTGYVHVMKNGYLLDFLYLYRSKKKNNTKYIEVIILYFLKMIMIVYIRILTVTQLTTLIKLN